jgi:membrane-bound serine protease (ClpP class)
MRMRSVRSPLRTPRAGWPRLRLLLAALAVMLGAFGLVAQEQAGRFAHLLELDGAVGPATADYLIRGIDDAAEAGAALVIIRMDTPGGLETSMRAINRAILSARVPVAVHVAPSGARAASAGTFISYAAHVAAMAPGTSIGPATPVQMGGFPGGPPQPDEGEPRPSEPAAEPDAAENGAAENGEAENGEAAAEETPARDRPAARPPADAGMAKAINDAVSHIRGMAELRGRNADWAERAVREAVTLTAREAAEQNVIDFVARSTDELLAQAHGRTVDLNGVEHVLDTEGLEVRLHSPDWRTQLLAAITNPQVALLLMILGFYGILFELFNPGTLVPGTIGAISLLTGLYALSILPFSFAGLALILLGLALIIAEAFSPSFGILGVGGTVAVVLGAIMIFDTDVPGMEMSWPALAALAVASLAFSLLVARLAVVSHRGRVTTGSEQLIGLEAKVLDWQGAEGHVLAHGERWRARAAAPLRPGQPVRVTARDGLTLEVAPEDDAARG